MKDRIKELKAEVIRLCTEYPDAVYMGRCSYYTGDVENGPPGRCGCIVGQALHNIDWCEVLTKRADEGIMYVLEAHGFEPSSDGLFIQQIQIRQDGQVPWGECLLKARKMFPQQ